MCQLELMHPPHHQLRSLSWHLNVAEVMVIVAFVAVILEDDVTYLEGCGSYGASIVALIWGLGNISIAGGIIISLISAGRSLIALNGHNWLILALLPPVVLLMLLHPLPLVLLALSLWYYHRTSMTNCVSSSSLRPLIQRLMHPLQV